MGKSPDNRFIAPNGSGAVARVQRNRHRTGIVGVPVDGAGSSDDPYQVI